MVTHKRPQHVGWTTDHALDGGKSSMGVLLDWLTTPGNYDRWRAPGASKMAVGAEIVERLEAVGIFHRRARDVYTKIYDIERSFHEAAAQLQDARRRLQQSKGTAAEPGLYKLLAQYSRYFMLLQPVMGDHAAASVPKKRPLLSTRRKPSPRPVEVTPEKPAKRLATRAASGSRAYADKQWQHEEEDEDVKFTALAKNKYESSPKKPKRDASAKERPVESDWLDPPVKFGADKPVEDTPVVVTMESIALERAQVELAMRRVELQAVRDQALVARVKARGELLDCGVSLDECDRLLPLDF